MTLAAFVDPSMIILNNLLSSPQFIDFASQTGIRSNSILSSSSSSFLPANNAIHDGSSDPFVLTTVPLFGINDGNGGLSALSIVMEKLTAQITAIKTDSLSSSASFSSMMTVLVAPPMPDVVTFISTIMVVTISDMIPFVPCQPLAIALGSSSSIGVWAYPICVIGQTCAGIISFLFSRYVTNQNLQSIQQCLNSLSPEAQEKFNEFRQLGGASNKVSGVVDTTDTNTIANEGKVLLALIGLRLAPFFPFSAGNYLLGGATSVGVRPFVIATLFGCLLSNFVSVVVVGVGGSELVQQVL